jgi:hypothetical protein
MMEGGSGLDAGTTSLAQGSRPWETYTGMTMRSAEDLPAAAH